MGFKNAQNLKACSRMKKNGLLKYEVPQRTCGNFKRPDGYGYIDKMNIMWEFEPTCSNRVVK